VGVGVGRDAAGGVGAGVGRDAAGGVSAGALRDVWPGDEGDADGDVGPDVDGDGVVSPVDGVESGPAPASRIEPTDPVDRGSVIDP